MALGSDHERSESDAGEISNKFGALARALEQIPGDSRADTDEWNKEAEEQRRQFERDQEAKDIVSRSLQGVIRVISNVAVLAIAAVAWHYILPSSLSWLSESQLTGLLRFLLSGLVVGSVSTYFRQHA